MFLPRAVTWWFVKDEGRLRSQSCKKKCFECESGVRGGSTTKLYHVSGHGTTRGFRGELTGRSALNDVS